ncbi:apses-domain-containing protein [Amylostereum chailletii]|nr:apses-domain-containing protein [Amylostereum chailletii]
MQAATPVRPPQPPAPQQQPSPVKIYNAVYSSVQVYECMVRSVAVMRRRSDSYVNATQILKVAGVDKGRRTKILEKEILPGKHEIVQGGYGKYQGTWIPLDRGRDIALQYGVAHLLAPLFDFVPSSASMGPLPPNLSNVGGHGGGYLPTALPAANLMPGSALALLNQGRAQGLFTPQSSVNQTVFNTGPFPPVSPAPTPGVSPTPPPLQQTLKRARSDPDQEFNPQDSIHSILSAQAEGLAAAPDILMADGPRSSSAAPILQSNGGDAPSPSKRARTEPPLAIGSSQTLPTPQPGSRPPSTMPQLINGNDGVRLANGVAQNGGYPPGSRAIRFASKPIMPRHGDRAAPLKDHRRAPILTTIVQRDDPDTVLDLLREIPMDDPAAPLNADVVLDDLGHTALHIAASVGRLKTVAALVASGADVHRGNYNGETPLIRACLMTNNFDQQSFGELVTHLHPSIRTLDTARKSILHHVVALAGIRNRAMVAGYYLDQIFFWIAEQEEGDFKSVVDLQDEHGDTALNIAARVGNRSLVRSFIDVGANRILPNKLGLRPGDFGVENEELGGGPRVEDLIASLRSGPSIPVQKSQDVIADMTAMVQGLGTEFTAELKAKQDALDVTQAHLRAATRELSEQRKQIQAWQARCAELDQVTQRIRNIERALADEDRFDWTGRSCLEGEEADPGPAFTWRGQNSIMAGLGSLVDVSFSLDAEPNIPPSDTYQSLVKMRRMKIWHKRMEQLMEQRLKSLHGASAEREFQCKKIVALCTGVPIDRVEAVSEN